MNFFRSVLNWLSSNRSQNSLSKNSSSINSFFFKREFIQKQMKKTGQFKDGSISFNPLFFSSPIRNQNLLYFQCMNFTKPKQWNREIAELSILNVFGFLMTAFIFGSFVAMHFEIGEFGEIAKEKKRLKEKRKQEFEESKKLGIQNLDANAFLSDLEKTLPNSIHPPFPPYPPSSPHPPSSESTSSSSSSNK